MTRTRRLFAPLAGAIAVLVGLVAVAAAQGSPAAVAAGATGATGSTGTGPLTASVTACHTDPLAANRYAIFASQMNAVPGTLTMSVSFRLEERSAGASGFTAVAAPGFDSWVTSQRGVGIFTYSHEVTALPAPAAFRVLVKARWLARRGRVVRVDEHLSPVCVEPLLQPDLALGAIARARPATGASDTWNVQVRNLGSGAAGPFEISLAIGSAAPITANVAGLAPAASQVVTLTAPHCAAGQTVTVTADSGHSITEPPDAKRTRTVGCPA